MIERKFLKEHITNLEIQEYLANILGAAEFSHADIKVTPVNTRIIIYVGRPGVAIGRAGKNIEKLTEDLVKKFGIKDPQLDIKDLVDPDVDAQVVANGIASALERNVKLKKVVNMYIDRIMEANAVGAEITISGKISGSRSRVEKTLRGYIKKCGDMAVENVDKGFATAVLKAGVLGVNVKIMGRLPESMMIEKKFGEIIRNIKSAKKEKKKEEETEGTIEGKAETKEEKPKEKKKAREGEHKEKTPKPKIQKKAEKKGLKKEKVKKSG